MNINLCPRVLLFLLMAKSMLAMETEYVAISDSRAEFIKLKGTSDIQGRLQAHTLEELISLFKYATQERDERSREIVVLLQLELATRLSHGKDNDLFRSDPFFLKKLNLDGQVATALVPYLLSNDLKNFLLRSSYTPLIIPEIVSHPLFEGLTIVDCQSFPRHIRFAPQGKNCFVLIEYNTVVQSNSEGNSQKRTFYDLSLYNSISGKRDAQITGLQEGEVVSCVISKGMAVCAVALEKQIVVWDLMSRKRLCAFDFNLVGFKEIGLSSDGKYLAIISSFSMMLYEAATGKFLHNFFLPVGETISFFNRALVKFTPDGKKIVAGTSNGMILQWDLANGQLVFKIPVHGDLITALHLEGDHIKSCGGDWKMKTIDKGQIVSSVVGNQSVHDVRFESQKLGAGFSHNGEIAVLLNHRQPGGTLFQMPANKKFNLPLKAEIKGCFFSPDDTIFGAVTAHEILVAPLNKESSFCLNYSHARTLAFSENSAEGRMFAIGFLHEVRFFHAFDNELREKLGQLSLEQALFLRAFFKAHEKKQEFIIIEPSYLGTIFNSLDEPLKRAVLTISRVVKVQPKRSIERIKLLRTDSAQNFIQDPFSYFAFTGERTPRVFGQTMQAVAAEVAKGLFSWVEPRLVRTIYTLEGHDKTITCIAYNSVKKKIASGSADGIIKIWDIETGNCSTTINAHEGIVFPLQFDSAGERLASASNDGICVWHVSSGKSLAKYHVAGSSSLAFDNSGELLIAGSMGGVITLCGHEGVLENYCAHKDAIWAIGMDALGNRIVSSDNSGALKVWQSQKPGVWKQPFLKYEGRLPKRMWHVAFDNDNFKDTVIFAHHNQGIDYIDIVDDIYTTLDTPLMLISPWLIVAGKPESRCIWIGPDNTIRISELKDMKTWIDPKAGPCTIL